LAPTADSADYNDENKAGAPSVAHTTTGTAEYMLTTPPADPTPTPVAAYFKMEYAPFGLADTAWTATVNGGIKPVWEIRNGLNDQPQDADTNFAAFAGGPSTGSTGSPTGSGTELMPQHTLSITT